MFEHRCPLPGKVQNLTLLPQIHGRVGYFWRPNRDGSPETQQNTGHSKKKAPIDLDFR